MVGFRRLFFQGAMASGFRARDVFQNSHAEGGAVAGGALGWLPPARGASGLRIFVYRVTSPMWVL